MGANGSFGVAGGSKYQSQNILFKFATDAKIGDVYLYGDREENIERATKALSNEMKVTPLIICRTNFSGIILLFPLSHS
jgi:hypothetical protein